MKTDKIRWIYLQIIFTILVFTLMVVLSYVFNSITIRANLTKNAESVLSFTHEKIDSELIASKMMLGNFAQIVRQMILDDNAALLQRYINITSNFVLSEESGLYNINGIYGYFENIFGEDLFITGIGWTAPQGFNPKETIWYKAIMDNCGMVIETEPYMDDFLTGQKIITYARCIHDAEDKHIGIVCIDVRLEKIGEIVTNTALSEGGYGLLATHDLTIISYANQDFIGKPLNDSELPFSEYINMFKHGEDLYEKEMKNWKGEDVIVFSRTLPNGWYLMLLSPKNLYYSGATRMLIVLCVLGAIMAAALIIILFRIDRAKAKADEESRQKSAFLANMSHEIRTPMNAIIGMTYIGKSADDIPRKDYCLNRIENASRHLLGVINDILDMSKIEANMFDLSYEEFDFEKTLQRVISIISFRADEKKQKITVNVDKSIPRTLIGDDQRLAQVITNLIGNAVKFTPEGGSIKLDTNFAGEEGGICTIRITVKDSGIGISEEQQKRLFRSFQQADSGTSRRFGGTGLGLVISKNIVELMGGKIELESEAGKGSSFSFTFNAKRGLANGVDLSGINVDWSNISVIAVDNDMEILDYFKDVMRSFGAGCDTALNAKEALSHIERNGLYHFYFIGWNILDMDGIALAKEIKARSGLSNNAVIMMTSAAEWSGIADEAKKAGIDKFISKPLFPSEIADVIAEAIGVQDHHKDEKKNFNGIFKGYKILLAEDVEINQEIISALIEPTLLKMDCVSNGREAAAMFWKSPSDYDLILMDVQMPEMDGCEATREIREMEAMRLSSGSIRRIPIIAMTANVFKEDIQKCLKAGMDEHIGKPVDVDEFFNVLQKYLPERG